MNKIQSKQPPLTLCFDTTDINCIDYKVKMFLFFFYI